MIRDEKHRRFIASLPCIVTGIEGSSQAAHIRKGLYAMGMKPDDSLCVPLTWWQHSKQHDIGEESFWSDYGGINRAKDFAIRLFENTGDEIMAREIN